MSGYGEIGPGQDTVTLDTGGHGHMSLSVQWEGTMCQGSMGNRGLFIIEEIVCFQNQQLECIAWGAIILKF